MTGQRPGQPPAQVSAQDSGQRPALGSVLLAGGGTAGHVSPLLALADCLRRDNPQVEITVVGTAEGLEARLVPERGYSLSVIPKVPLPRKPSGALLALPGNLRRAVAAAEQALVRSKAQVVVGFGGYVSSPAYLAARRHGIPIVVHEQNARPGLANRLGARLASEVAVTFPGTPLPRAVVTGMPLRAEIAHLDRAARRAEAQQYFGLEQRWPTLLVTGGSLGAARINAALSGAAEALGQAGVQVLHLTGKGKNIEVRTGGADRPRYVVAEYADRMDLAYAAADLVLGRAGANTVCELTAVGLPAVYVPLPIGNGEQRDNVATVVRAGGGLLVDDGALDPSWVLDTVPGLLLDPARLASMSLASAAVGERDGDRRLADLVTSAVAKAQAKAQSRAQSRSQSRAGRG